VFADRRGIYKSELPVGTYTMTAAGPGLSKFQEYERPPFLVSLPENLTLKVTIDPEGPTCDPILPESGQLPSHDDSYPTCGRRRDLFPIASNDNVPFELLIRYRTRRAYERGYNYNTGKDWPSWKTPVFLAYNLFTLRADHVVYDAQSRTLRAMGIVVAVAARGITRHAASMTLQIENGQISPTR